MTPRHPIPAQVDPPAAHDYLSVIVAGQMFGLPLHAVQDVFRPERMTPIPSAGAEIAGVMNLRGRIVTVLDMRARLKLPPRAANGPPMAVGIELDGESYGLIVDRVGEVLRLSPASFSPNPPNLDPRWVAVSAGVHQLDAALMIIFRIDKLLDIRGSTAPHPADDGARDEMQRSMT